MDTLEYVLGKWQLSPNGHAGPTEIAGAGRGELARLFAELGYKSGAEIGVWQGSYSRILCRANPGLRLYAVDAWQAYDGYADFPLQAQMDDFYRQAVARLAPYAVEIVRAFSVPASQRFENGSLDFIYLDANHELSYVVADLAAWAPKVRPGGIVAGHDYFRPKRAEVRCHVAQAVSAYTDAYGIRPWFVLGASEKGVPGAVRDGIRSWFWVVP